MYYILKDYSDFILQNCILTLKIDIFMSIPPLILGYISLRKIFKK